MKKLTAIIAAAFFSYGVYAQVDTKKMPENEQDQNKIIQKQSGTQSQSQPQTGSQTMQYCAKEKDGRVVMVSGQKEISNDITLANGTKIKTVGPVVEKKDGTTKTLRDGECVDAQGNIIKKSDMKMNKSDDMQKKNDNKMRKNEYNNVPKGY